MQLSDLIYYLGEHNHYCYVDDSNKLRVKGSLPPEISNQVRLQKDALIAYLRDSTPTIKAVLANEGWQGELLELVYWSYMGSLPKRSKEYYKLLFDTINIGPNSKSVQDGTLLKQLKNLKAEERR